MKCLNKSCRLYRLTRPGCAYGYDMAGTCETRGDKSEWIPKKKRSELRAKSRKFKEDGK